MSESTNPSPDPDAGSGEPGQRRAAWAKMPPGRGLGQVMENLEWSSLDEFDLVDAVTAYERQIAHLHALQARAVHELSTRPGYADCEAGDDPRIAAWHTHDRAKTTGRETGTALTLTHTQGANHAAVCISLAERRRSTMAALQDGRITLGKARIIVDGVRWLDDEWLEAEVEGRLLEAAPAMTERQLRRKLHRMVMAADPATVNKRYHDRRQRRRVEPPVPDDEIGGIATLTLSGPAEDLVALCTAIDAAARTLRRGGDERTLDQLRFDLLTGIGWATLATGVLTGAYTGPAPGNTTSDVESGSTGGVTRTVEDSAVRDVPLASRHGRAAMVHVTVPITTLLGLDDHPGDLTGYGPIPADAARRTATSAIVHRMLTDPVDGRLLEYGRTTYAPPQELEDFIQARDVRCAFPGCEVPADGCDIDHAQPYAAGGTTGASNNHVLSRGCHVDKTLHGCTLEHSPDSSYRWRSPAGHSYVVPPEAVGPIRHFAVPAGPPPGLGSDPPPF